MVVRHEVLQHERQAGIAGPYLERSQRNLDPERMIEFLIEAPLAPGIVRRQDRVLEGVVAQVQVEIVLQAGSLPGQRDLAAGKNPVAVVPPVIPIGIFPVELVAELQIVTILGEPQEMLETRHPVVGVADLLSRGQHSLVEVLALIPSEGL